MEMQMVHATLMQVSREPSERLSEQDKLWARLIRELSYNMEDAIDAFMVRVARREATLADTDIFRTITHKVTSPIKKIKERHHISEKIKDIKNLSKEISELHTKYKFSSGAPPRENIDVDPRVINLFKKEEELVGIEEAKEDLIQILMHSPEDKSHKIVSIVGCGGLGKTTLAKVVHHQLNKALSFDCCAFVSVGRNPNITNTLREMLERLGKTYSMDIITHWDIKRFCEALQEFLQDKRYNIVVDDVWEQKTWEAINHALPDCDSGSKVIVTTRNCAVISTKDSSNVYKLKQLTAEKSKELFDRRMSGRNGENELVDKIIDKCDGVPLSIIAIASLLANRPLEDWQTVYNSLIVGREEDRTRTILLYSYHDLPYYLKPCLLYLSMYPEDFSIYKDTLIWRWIAEGFVQPDRESGNLFEIGERYFNELTNRSMIEPGEYKLRTGVIYSCRVHDIVLDLIRDLSTEENFVTVLSEKKLERDTSIKEVGLHGLERKKVRRLSIQWSNKTKFTPQDAIGMPEVLRSLDTRDCFIDNPLLSSLQACRVLAVKRMDYCSGDLKHLGKLLNLRYLEIQDYPGELEIPKEIGKLKSLQTLILLSHKLKELPAAVCELTQLVCLHVYGPEKVPVERMGNLMRLEVLKLLVLGKAQGDMLVVELGKLTRLRFLAISFSDVRANETFYMALVQSLNNLQELRELWLWSDGDPVLVSAWKSWEPPRQLWYLYADMALFSSQSQLMSRCLRLHNLCLVEVEGVDMGILALLPELVYLKLKDPPCYRHNDGCIIVGAEGFKNLRVCKIPRVLKFLPGAMPSLESLCFMVRPAPAEESSNLEWGLGNLVSLKEVEFGIDCLGCLEAEVQETTAKLKHAAESHPKRLTIQIKKNNLYYMIDEDDFQPDKVLTDTVHVRDQRIKRYDGVDVGYLRYGLNAEDVEYWLCHYRCLEEINCNIDCEGSTLSKVERMEAWIRQAAARHNRRPKLLAMNMINQDKMRMGDSSCDDGDSLSDGKD